MTSHRFALRAATAAVAMWAAKAVAIAIAGGLSKSPAESPLFFAGLATFVVAIVSLGVAATAASRIWVRVVAGIGAFVAGIACFLVIDGVVATIRGPEEDAHWAWTEVNLWVVALLVLGLATVLHRSRQRRADFA